MGIDLPLCPEDVDEVLRIIIANEKLKNPKVTFKSGTKLGEGYLSINSAVEISDSNKTLYIFIKVAPKQLTMRKVAHIRAAYKNELHFYKTIYPSMATFYEKKTGKSLTLVPKIYAANAEEMKEILAFENLRTGGYSLNGRKNLLDKEQVNLIMKEYGKFHAISFALKDQQEQLFTKLSKNLPQLLYLWLDAMKVIPTVKAKCKIMEKYLESDGDDALLEKIKYFSENIENFLLKIKTYNGEHRIILHGDCNYNNMMFRKKENNLEVRFLDFQAINLNSPVMDLVYFFYGSASSEENLSQLDFFLNIYHDSLSMTIRELGSDPEKLCPSSVIKEHWKIFSVFGLMIAFVTTSMMVNEAEVLVDILEATGSETSTYCRSKREPMKNEKEFARRIKYLIKHFSDNSFI